MIKRIKQYPRWSKTLHGSFVDLMIALVLSGWFTARTVEFLSEGAWVKAAVYGAGVCILVAQSVIDGRRFYRIIHALDRFAGDEHGVLSVTRRGDSITHIGFKPTGGAK